MALDLRKPGNSACGGRYDATGSLFSLGRASGFRPRSSFNGLVNRNLSIHKPETPPVGAQSRAPCQA